MGCHFLLQCLKVKGESEVSQSCLTLRDPVVCSLPGSSVHGIFQARVLEWGVIAFSSVGTSTYKFRLFQVLSSHICLVAVSLDGTMPNIFFFSFLKFRCNSLQYYISFRRSVQFSHSDVSDSLWPHESQHTRAPCPSPTPGVHSDSRPLSQ